MSRKFERVKGKPLDPKEYGVDISDPEEVKAWREFLKVSLIRERSWICECGCEEPCVRGRDLHEGIVTRGNTRGLWWQPWIFHEINCYLIKHEHHIYKQMRRDHFLQLAEERYGVTIVDVWLNSLPFKVRIR